MQNHRPNQPHYNSKSTNNHPNIPTIIPEDKLPIKQINISDKDKKGNTIYTGSSSGGRGTTNRMEVGRFGVRWYKSTYKYTMEELKPTFNKYWSNKTKKRLWWSFNKPQCIGAIKTIDNKKYRIISFN